MDLTRPEVVSGLLEEYAAFADLVAGLAPAGWEAPTRCTRWQVRDVAAHVLGNAVDTLHGTIGGRSQDQQAAALRGHGPPALAAELRAAAGRLRPVLGGLGDGMWHRPSRVPGLTVGDGVRTLWHDTYVHGDDIRAALGLPGRRGAALHATVGYLRDRLTRAGWGPARFELEGLGVVAVGSGGPLLRADPLDFVLVATGRADPALLGVDDSIDIYR
jgi:uncharacterized protein (TIGR03083 family)